MSGDRWLNPWPPLLRIKGDVYASVLIPKGKTLGSALAKALWKICAIKIKQNTDPPQVPSIKVEGHEEAGIIVIQVEESPIKPVWAFGRPLKRVGRTNQHLSRKETHRMVEATTGRTWDALPSVGFSLKEAPKEYVRDLAT
jgi:predicted HTH transcriptional regulator